MTGADVTSRPDRCVLLHPLVYLEDGDETTIGRPDIDSYAVFPADGAQLVRRLAAGDTPAEAARWYEQTYGEPTDVEHVVAAMTELGFVRDGDQAETEIAAVRWQRLGRAAFHPVAWVAYGLLLGWAAVTMVRAPDLRPTYADLFFCPYYTVIVVALFVGAMPLALLHEAFHALAGRRLGIRSRMRMSRRLYYIVLETALDGLVAVPRRKRYLPILAGLVADVLVIAILVIVAGYTRSPDGTLPLLGRLCQAFTFATVLRVVWQFFFYLRTDIYMLITTVLGCTDLHGSARNLLENRVRRWLRRPPVAGPPASGAVDRRAARWYSWFIVIGYSFSIATLLLAVIPASYQIFAGVIHRLSGSGNWAQNLDAVLFLALTLPQIAFTIWLGVRERRQRAAAATLEHLTA